MVFSKCNNYFLCICVLNDCFFLLDEIIFIVPFQVVLFNFDHLTSDFFTKKSLVIFLAQKLRALIII